LAAELGFEWDADKASKNVEKHQVSFEEAATVFDDPMFITFIDDEHSLDEERYITIGLSSRGRLLIFGPRRAEGSHSHHQCSTGHDERGTVLCRSQLIQTTTSCVTSMISPQ
jgi:uncharacterized DUF497 family protein